MKIKKLDIYGYGKWVNQQFDLDDQLQVFFGQNEAGKSTLQSFIRSMLFGFPTKHKRKQQKNSYEPKVSNHYGGRILITETEYGDIWLERTGKKLSLTKTNGEILDNQVLNKLLSGLDDKLFDTFYAFNLENFSEFSRLNAEQLNDYFMSIGTVGSDQFLKVAKQLEKETDDMYRIKGQNRPLNIALSEYDALAKRVETTKNHLLAYDQLVQQRDYHEQEILKLNQTIVDLEKEGRELDKLITRFDSYNKYQEITEELSTLSFYEIAPSYPEIVSQSLSKIEEIGAQIIEIQDSNRLIEGELGTLTRFNWAVNHQELRKKWEHLTSQAKEAQAKVEMYEMQIKEHEQKMAEQAKSGLFYPELVANTLEYYRTIESGQDFINQMDALEDEMDRALAERNVLLEQRRQFQNYAVTVRSQIAKLENQRLNDQARLVEETSISHFFLGAFLIVIGIGLFIFNYFYNANLSPLMWGSIGSISVGVISFVYVIFNHRKKFEQFYGNPIVDKISQLKNNERSYQEQSQSVGIEMNQREEFLGEKRLEIESLKDQIQTWKKNMGFYPNADLELIVKVNPVKAYFENEQQLKEIETLFENEKETLHQWRSQLQPFFERFPTDLTHPRALIRYVQDLEGQLKVVQLRGQHLQENIQKNLSQILKLQEKIHAIESQLASIFEETQSQSEFDFFMKVKNNEKILELKEKQQMYDGQFSGYESLLKEIETKDTLLEQAKRIENRIHIHKEYLLPHQSERANLEVQIRQMEQDGHYQVLVQQLEAKKEEVKTLIYHWGTKRLAMELLYRTLRYGIADPIPKMTQLANAIFEKLSSGRYHQIKLNKKGIKVMQFSGILFEPHELSQGTLEQLYVALRLAFVESATSIVKLPIIIDDAFVNFDQQRKENTYEVLKTFCRTTQILYFTTSKEVIDIFSNSQIQRLDEISENNDPKDIPPSGEIVETED